jgi:hypothetical protein
VKGDVSNTHVFNVVKNYHIEVIISLYALGLFRSDPQFFRSMPKEPFGCWRLPGFWKLRKLFFSGTIGAYGMDIRKWIDDYTLNANRHRRKSFSDDGKIIKENLSSIPRVRYPQSEARVRPGVVRITPEPLVCKDPFKIWVTPNPIPHMYYKDAALYHAPTPH